MVRIQKQKYKFAWEADLGQTRVKLGDDLDFVVVCSVQNLHWLKLNHQQNCIKNNVAVWRKLYTKSFKQNVKNAGRVVFWKISQYLHGESVSWIKLK